MANAENLLVGIVQSLRAGFFEELGFVAIPVALVLFRTKFDRPSNKWIIVGLIVGSGLARALPPPLPRVGSARLGIY